MVATVEMDFWDWAGKVAEKLTFIRLNVGSNRDITEEDYCLLECLYKMYYNGEYPLYQTKLALAEDKSVQSTIFDAIEIKTELPQEPTDLS